MTGPDTEPLERRGDLLFQRLGYYGFVTVVGASLILTAADTFGLLIFCYGVFRFVLTGVRIGRTVLDLRRAVQVQVSTEPTPGRGRDARPGVALPAEQGGTAGRASDA